MTRRGLRQRAAALAFTAVLAGAACAAAACAGPAAAQNVRGVVLDEPVPIAPFALRDHAGAPFALEHLRGRWSLVFLGYTHCPDVCPFTLANLEAVRAELSQLMAPDALPQIVFLAVDPERDSPLLADYVAHFGIDFIGITGASDEIASLSASLDGFYRLEKDRLDDTAYLVAHTAAVAVVDPDGAVVAKISPPFAPFPTAAWLNRLIREGPAS